jgi:two-component system chemotaxis response regulator CheY
VTEAEELRRQRALERRLQGMGLEAGLLPGGRAVVATLPLGPEPFETPDASHVLRAVRFYTVGFDRIKCVAPRALFHLPLIRILDCEKASDLEQRIREVWTARLKELRDARRWLGELGITAETPQGAPAWTFGLGLEDERARATVIERGRVVLPSRGPLSGFALAEPADRVFAPESSRSGTELAIAVTVRLEELARRKRDAAVRRSSEDSCDLPAPRPARTAPLLLVGARLASAHALHESLRLRGFAVHCVTSGSGALDAFRGHSFGLVLVETKLDRADGIELVPALRALPGVLDLPVVLLDERPHDPRRAAAKAAGASGYFAGLADASRLAAALAQLGNERKRRRFARYERALSVSWPGCETPAVTVEIGRLGCRLRGDVLAPARGRFALHLPETSRTLRVEAELLYRTPGGPGWSPSGVGMRFGSFESNAEPLWIEYVSDVDRRGRTRGGAPDGSV